MEQNGSVPSLSGYQDITTTFNRDASKVARSREELAAANKKKEIQFKASHLLLMGFFLWLAVLHGLGIYFFTKGFLLTRLVLDEKSQCGEPPYETGLRHAGLGSHETGCWHPKTFDKAVIIIIDALRYDFTVPHPGSDFHFHNALSVLHETAVQSPEKAYLLPFIADPPTTTLQRLKGLTTGNLPTFIDAGSNFAGQAIEEDSIVSQLREANRNLVHLGDDTWHSLFPDYFDANLTHAYDSFEVWDLFTVDNGVTEHLFPLLQSNMKNKWDVIFGHYLGVDHAGHRYGPNHPATASKLQEMDHAIRRMIADIDDDTLLVVMGDHGMDTKGDHGGESDDEVEAALWMYSKKGVFGRGQVDTLEPPAHAKERPVRQIDLVSTLSLLLGLPIPFNNLGAPISEAFVGSGEPDWRNLASVNALTAAQIKRYQLEYAKARGLDDHTFSVPDQFWRDGLMHWQAAAENAHSTHFDAAYTSFAKSQQETLSICRGLWARFDVTSMLQGVAILGFGIIFLAAYARSSRIEKVDFIPLSLGPMSLFATGGGLLFSLVDFAFPGFYITDAGLIGFNGTFSIDSGLLGLAVGGIVGFGYGIIKQQGVFNFPRPRSLWGWLAGMFTVGQSIGYASNSYTIWEDEIMLFFLSLFAILALASSFRQQFTIERRIGVVQSALFLSLNRLISFSRLCREEQMPYCRSTYYASGTSSTSAPWQLAIPLLGATALPFVIEYYYRQTRSYEGPAKLWVGVALRIALLGAAVFWILDAADDNNWLSIEKSTLKTIKNYIARFILAGAVTIGASVFTYRGNCIKIEVTDADDSDEIKGKPKSVKIFGYANAHGSRYLLLVTNALMALTLVQKPMGNGAMAILTIQILALVDILDSNNLSAGAIGPIVLGLLGSYHFFKTGHQATLSSIQWETAFVPLTTIKYPWSPILVVLNSFGAQILTTIAVPLTALWKKAPTKRGLLSDVARSMATYILYHGVINLATTMWAGHLRRHLMLYRIFCPKFMTGAAALLIVDIVGALISIGMVRWNFSSVAEVFGWSS